MLSPFGLICDMIMCNKERVDKMKLNPDCVRSVLLYLEENQLMDDKGLINPIYSSKLPDKLTKYKNSDVLYSIKQLDEYGYIETRQFDTVNYSSAILDITPYGHEFLKNIHNDTTWNKTKEIAQQVGSTSLNTLANIASSVVASLITAAIQSQL